MRVKISDLMPDTPYFLQVRSSNGVDVSAWSQQFEITTSSDTVIPDTPQNVTWEQVGDAFVGGWDSVTTNEEGQPSTVVRYEVVLINGADTVYQSVPQLSEARVSYHLSFDQNVALFLTPRGTVQFAVRAVDNKGLKSQWSSPITAVNDPPGPVTELSATSLTDGVYLSWKAPTEDTDLIGYNIYVGVAPNPTTKFNDQPVTNTELYFGSSTYQTHYFKVAAVDRFNQESTTVEVSAAPLSPFGGDSEPPTEPTDFAVTISDDPAGMLLTQRALATWTASVDDALAGYHIRYKQSGTTNWRTVNVPPDAEQPYLVTTGLTPNVEYDFEIRAYDAYTNKSAWVALSTNAVTPTVEPTLSHALQIAGGGYIESASYGAGVGFRIDEDSITIHNGAINAGAVTTGVLRSSEPAIDASGNPVSGEYAWQIDLEGDAVLGNARIRGNMVVGNTGETFTSRVQSYNYVPGETGWKIDSDGWAEFRQVEANSLNGNAITANTLSVDTLAGGTLGVPINLAGTIKAVNEGSDPDLVGSYVSLGPEGFLVKGPDVLDNPTYVSFPIDGRPNIISGTLQATTLTVEGDSASGQAATFRRNSQMEPGASLTLNDSITAPVGAPLFESVINEVYPNANITYSGNMEGATYSSSDNSIYYITTLKQGSEWTNTVFRYSITDNVVYNVTTVAFKPSASYDYTYQATGITKMGTDFWISYISSSGMTWAIQSMGSDWVNQGFMSALSPSSSNGYTLGNDGSNLWLAMMNSSNQPVFYKLDNAANVLETVNTGFTIQTSSKGGSDIFSLNVGNFDFGARKFILSYYWSETPNEYTVNIYEDMVTFGTTGAREMSNEFNLMRKGSDAFLVWKGTSNNDSSGEFWQISESGRVPEYFRYSNLRTNYRWGYWHAGSTYYRSSDNAETGVSPSVQGTMYTRWWWKVTMAAPPTGLASRVYLRVSSGTGSSTFTRQATLAVGQTTYTSNLVNWSNPGVGDGSVGFGAGTPSIISSQATFERAYNFQTWSGSTYIEGSGFDPSLVGKMVTGTSIPAGTYIASYLSSTQVYLSQNATATVWAQRSIHLPRLEIRGDGYARIRELERVIIASTVDASTSSSNEPALRIGDINGNHMRVDGDELISMTNGSTQGTLYLNDGGITKTSKLVITSTQDATALSGNEPPLRIGDINGNHLRIDGNELQSMSSDSSVGDLILQQTGTVRIAGGILEIPNIVTTSAGANVNYNSTNARLRYVTSSRRWKSDIKPMTLDAERLLELEPKTFKSKIEDEDQDKVLIGFIAEEAHDLGLSQWVEYEKDGETPQSFAYATWSVALQQIARAQQKRIEELEHRLEKLSARLDK